MAYYRRQEDPGFWLDSGLQNSTLTEQCPLVQKEGFYSGC